MRWARYFVWAIVALCGCESLSKPKVDNPVLEPPPPRVSTTEDGLGQSIAPGHPQYPKSASLELDGQEPGSVTDVQPVSFVEVADRLTDNTVVATVDGVPIFAAEVLERHAPRLAQAAGKASAEELHQAKLQLIRQDLNGHIERKLLVEALRENLKPEQIEALDKTLDTMFAEQMERMKQELKVHSRHELELEAQKQGTSLAQLHDAFAAQLMAAEFLKNKSKSPGPIGRAELLAYYRENGEKYSFPAQVRWQQVVVSFEKHGGRKEALAKLEEAIAELRKGADFGDIARRYSDGPRAAEGGQWDWTKAGSLADENTESTLFRLEPGTISTVIEGENDFRLVKVNQRREQGQQPFEEVQDEIKKTLEQQAQREAAKQVIAELQQEAVIKSIFDDEDDAPGESTR